MKKENCISPFPLDGLTRVCEVPSPHRGRVRACPREGRG